MPQQMQGIVRMFGRVRTRKVPNLAVSAGSDSAIDMLLREPSTQSYIEGASGTQ